MPMIVSVVMMLYTPGTFGVACQNPDYPALQYGGRSGSSDQPSPSQLFGLAKGERRGDLAALRLRVVSEPQE